MQEIELIVELEDQGKRVDVFIAQKNPEISRSSLAQFKKSLKINQKPAKLSTLIKEKDHIFIKIKPIKKTTTLKAENIPIPILYEDEDLMVVNKPYGMVVHPAAGNWKGTLVNALYHKLLLSQKGEEDLRPGVVHRLDKETSGLMMLAKNLQTQEELMFAFSQREVLKIYHAVVLGYLQYSIGTIDAPLKRHPKTPFKYAVDYENGKEALTEYKVLKQFDKASLVELTLHTGRTHQIRVHLTHMGAPIVGDQIYGKKNFSFPMALLSKKLGFFHPTKKTWLEFEIDYPKDFQNTLEKFCS